MMYKSFYQEYQKQRGWETLNFVFWIQTSSRRARFISMATVQNWFLVYAKTPRRAPALRWVLLEDALTRFNTHKHTDINPHVQSVILLSLQWRMKIAFKSTMIAFPLQFTASSPREAREWVDQINFVLKGKPHMKCIFIEMQNIFIPFYKCIWLGLSTTVIILRWKGQFYKKEA